MARGLGKPGDGFLNLVFADLRGRRIGSFATVEGQLRPAGLHRRWRNVPGMMDVALGLRAAMHELGNESGASIVHGVDYQPPAVPVRFRSKPRLVEVTLAVGRQIGRASCRERRWQYV